MKRENISCLFCKILVMLIAIILIPIFQINAQPQVSNNNQAFSIEIGKTGLLYNLTYDYKFNNKNKGLRVVVGSNFSNKLPAFTTGVGGYYLVGKNKSFLELGIDLNYLTVEVISDDQRGITLFYPNYPIRSYYANANIGFRKYSNNTIVRIGISPGFNKIELIPGGFLSMGFSF